MANLLEPPNSDNQGLVRPSPRYLTRPDAYGASPVTVEAESSDIEALTQYLGILWRWKWVLAGCAVVGALLGLGASLAMTPIYQAVATLEIQDIQEPFSNPLLAGDPTLTTHSQLISSRAMRNRALAEIYLRPVPDIPEVLEPLAGMREWLGMQDPAASVPWNQALAMASQTLEVEAGGDSRILVIGANSANPQAAAAFVNTLAAEYIERSQEERWEAYQDTSTWLQRAEEELRTALEQSEQELVDFARDAGLLFMGGSTNVTEERLKQLQAELAQATADRIARYAVYEASLSSPTEALPEVLDSGPMAQYQVRLSELRRELAQLLTTFTPAHFRVQQVQAQIEELEKSQEAERSSIIRRIQIEYEAALNREQQLREDFESQSVLFNDQAELLIQYNILQRQVETNKSLYNTTLQSGREASIAAAMRPAGARIVDAAMVPIIPMRPNVALNMGLGVIALLMLGVSSIVLYTWLDTRIQTPGVGDQLHVRELGVIPSAGIDPDLRGLTQRLSRQLREKAAGTPGLGRLLAPDSGVPGRGEGLEMATWSRGLSIMAEAFRATMTSILFSGDSEDRPRTLLITSPSPREGKSTVVSNLAIALAEIGHRVLLIDGDMRLPRIHNVFDVPNTFGLSDILHERTPVEQYPEESLVRKTVVPNLYVLPAGPARAHLARLFYSPRMKQLMARFRESFDTVLVDSAPVLAVPDARILARSTEAVILVFRARKTNEEGAMAAVRCFAEDGRRVLGTILNDWNPEKSRYGYYYNHYVPYQSPYETYGTRIVK